MAQTKQQEKVRVAVGLSGGVDSAVTAAGLVEAGFEVTGVFLECWRAPGCRVDEDRRDAMDVARKLGIDYKVLDFKDAYREKVVDYFRDEYLAGRTPNPDVMCNREIKFGMFYDWALRQAQGKLPRFDYVATGHYARVVREKGKYVLKRGVDAKKDQSYFLYQLREEQLAHIMFPLGEMRKDQVRAQAKQLGLSVAEKPDSQGICFIGEVSVRQFLKDLGVEEKRGVVMLGVRDEGDLGGRELLEVGEHDGVFFYTVGQKLGVVGRGSRERQRVWVRNLREAGMDPAELPPLYIVEKDVARNRLVVGTREQVMRGEFEVKDVHWVGGDEGILKRVQDDSVLRVRIRHGGKLMKVDKILRLSGDSPIARNAQDDTLEWNSLSSVSSEGIKMQIELSGAAFGVAPGQAVVFYDGEMVLGGGVIT